MMTRSGRYFAMPQAAQLSAERLLADRQPELVEHPLCQIHQPPAHHTMDGRDRPALHHLHQGTALIRGQDRRPARGPAVQQPIQSKSVERQHPVAHGLQADAAERRGRAARASLVNRRQSQQTPGLVGIPGLPGKGTKLPRTEIISKLNRTSHGNTPVCHGESHEHRVGEAQSESGLMEDGIIPHLMCLLWG